MMSEFLYSGRNKTGKSRPNSSVPGPGEGKRGEEGHLGYLLRQAAGVHRLRMERALADFGVTSPQFSILTMLAAYPGASNADLARLAILTPQTLSVIVSNLVRMGAVERRQHAVHGRIHNLELSEKGRALLAKCRKRVHEIDREMTLSLKPAEEMQIKKWLVGLSANLSPRK